MRYQLRDQTSAYHFGDDGSVTLIVWRRVEASSGMWNELTFSAGTIREAETLYSRYCQDAAEKSQKQAARRARWGPLEVSRPT